MIAHRWMNWTRCQIRIGDAGFALRNVEILNALTNLIALTLARRGATVRDVAFSFWSGAYALGTSSCGGGVPMTDRAAQIGCERVTIPKGATQSTEAHDYRRLLHENKASRNTFAKRVWRSIVEHNINGELPVPAPRGRRRMSPRGPGTGSRRRSRICQYFPDAS